jgi:hypothetical protein
MTTQHLRSRNAVPGFLYVLKWHATSEVLREGHFFLDSQFCTNTRIDFPPIVDATNLQAFVSMHKAAWDVLDEQDITLVMSGVRYFEVQGPYPTQIPVISAEAFRQLRGDA